MNIAVAQSGGPTAAINSSLAGVFIEARKNPLIDKIYGSLNGIEGILNNKIIDLKTVFRTDEDVELLKHTPSTVLGSCRFKLPEYEDNSDIYEKIIAYFKRHDIGMFFYIGGNDSMDTVAKLSRYTIDNNIDIKIMGVPKTIDNDLMYTDHTPGFGSAAKYVAATVQEIICDSTVYSMPSVTIIEIMGRDAGWLTASTCVLRANGEIAPHLIYLPESPFTVEGFLNDIRRVQKEHKAVIVAVSEGVTIDKESKYANAEFQSGAVDAFGHSYLSGIGKLLENIASAELKCKLRSIELNVMQRCSSHIASKTDIDEAELVGSEAVKAALNGETGKMSTIERVSDTPYSVTYGTVNASEVANHIRYFPNEWINDSNNNVKDEAINYFKPLILGELSVSMKNGMPLHFPKVTGEK